MNTRVMVSPASIDEDAYLAHAASLEAQSIHGAGRWWQEVLSTIAGVEDKGGDSLPWQKCGDFRLRPGELTIWAGRRGHHKSFVTGQIAAWLARDTRVGIASFEMPPRDTLIRMIRQCAGCEPAVQYASDWIEAMDPMLRIYDDCRPMTPKRVLALIHHLAHDLGCTHVFIDSLMKVGIAPDDYARQKTFVDELTIAAKRYAIHIHLVAHLRKSAGKSDKDFPDGDDVAGGADIVNLAHNVVIVWSDKQVAELREKQRLGFRLDDKEQEIADSRTHVLKLDKQRNGRDQLRFHFWLDERSMQFCPTSDRRRLEWMPQGYDFAKLKRETALIATHDPQEAA